MVAIDATFLFQHNGATNTNPTLITTINTMTVKIKFDEPVTNLDNTDITLSDSASGTLSVLTTTDNKRWTCTFTAATNYESAAGLYFTLANTWDPVTGSNTSTTVSSNNQTATDYIFSVDTLAPTMTIVSTEVSDGDTSNDPTLSLTFTSSEATTTFAVGDITVSNGSITSFAATSSTVYTATFTPAGQGACTIDVAGSTFTDAVGNDNIAAAQFNWLFDSVSPTVISFLMSDTILTWGETSTVTLVFSEAVTGFNSDDNITPSNGTVSTMISSDNITWTGTFTSTYDVNDAVNVLSLSNSWTDTAGNAGTIALTSNYTVNTTTPWPETFSVTQPELLYDPSTIAIRFGQCRFNLTGDLSNNRINDLLNNITRFSEFNLDYQNNFNKLTGATFDISMNSFKTYFYEGMKLKPYRRQHFEDIGISNISGNITFIKDVSNNNASIGNTDYVTSFFDEIINHILASKEIPSMQYLSTDSLMYLISIFGEAQNLDDLCVLFNRNKPFIWEYKGLNLNNLNRLLAIRYDAVNGGTAAMDIINDDDLYMGAGNKWTAISTLFANPENQPGHNWKNKTAYFVLSLLFYTKETNVDDIEFLLYFRTSGTGLVTMKTALVPKKKT